MLTLSENAATVLNHTRSEQGLPEGATLRVAESHQDGQTGLSVGFVDQPVDGDHTAESHGLPYCVAPEVADALDEAKLDVTTENDTPQLVVVPAS